MYKSYVLTEDKVPISPRQNIRNKMRSDSNTETIDFSSKSRAVINRYSSVKQKTNYLTKSENLPKIQKPIYSKKSMPLKNTISSSLNGAKLPEISKRLSGGATISDSNDVFNDKRNFNMLCKLYEIWFDIELKFDNRQECINLIKYYFKYVKEEILNQGIETDDFNFFIDNKWNILFTRIAKLQGIIVVVLLIILNNFPDQNLGQIRKMMSNCSLQLITFLENYIIDKYEMKQSFMEKFYRVKDTLRSVGKNNVIPLLLRNLDHIVTTIKSFMYFFLI